MKRIATIIFHAAVFALLSLEASSQSPVAGSTGSTGSVEGIVIRSGTQESVPDASVELLPFPYGGSSGPYVMDSGSDGRFQFRNIPAGRYQLSASHSGFIRGDYGPRSLTGARVPLNVEASLTTTNIRLSLVPSAVISGRVFNPHGDPLGGTLIWLYQTRYVDGRTVISTNFSAKSVMTDDLGNFRFFSLMPGKYYVCFPYPASGAGSLNVYYPNTIDPRNAQAIELTPGRNVDNINLTAQTESPRHIRGRFNFDGGNAFVSFTSVNTDAFPAGSVVAVDPVSGEFNIPYVAPGMFVLSASSGNLRGWTLVDVRNTDVENVSLTIRPGIDVPVHVSLDPAAIRAKVDTASLSFWVEPDPPIPGVSSSTFVPETNGSFTLQSSAGDYRIFLRPSFPNPRNAYIKSIRLGSSDILNDGLHLDSGTVGSIEIVIGSSPGTLDGVVTDERKQPDSNAALILAPDPSHRKRTELLQYAYPDASGRFHFENIPPGDYSVFALEDIAPGPLNTEWQNPEFLRKYENHSSLIHIDEGSKSNIQVTAVRADLF